MDALIDVGGRLTFVAGSESHHVYGPCHMSVSKSLSCFQPLLTNGGPDLRAIHLFEMTVVVVFPIYF